MRPARGVRALAFVVALAPAVASAQGATLEKIAGQPAAPASPSPSPAAPGESSADDSRVWEIRATGIREPIVSALAMSPADSRTILAATSRGVIYRSTDGGRTWNDVLRVRRARAGRDSADPTSATASASGASSEADTAIEEFRQQTFDDLVEELTPQVGEDEAIRQAQDLADQAVEDKRQEIVAAANDEQADSARANTEDEDANAPPARRAIVRQISWDPTFPGLVYAATVDGIWRSGDGGESWVQLAVGVGDEERDAICIAPSAGSPDRILVGTASGLLVTDDGGLNWARAQGDIAAIEIRALAIDPDRRATIAVGTITGAFLSIDGGETFRRVYAAAGEAADVRALAFAPGESANLYEGTANGLFLVTPDDARPIGVGQFRSPAIRSIVAPAGDPERLYVGTSKGVYESRDAGKTFVELFRGLSSPDAFVVGEDYAGPDGLIAGTTLGLFRLVPERLATAPSASKVGGPSFSDLLRAAAKYGRFDSDRVAGWKHDARWAALLPKVNAQYRTSAATDRHGGFTEARDLNGTLIGRDPASDSYPYTRNDLFVVTFTWQFDQLLAGQSLHRIMQEVAQIGRLRNQKLSKVARLARERKDVASRLAAGIEDADDRTSLQLRLQELDAYLDAATGGFMSNSSRSRRP